MDRSRSVLLALVFSLLLSGCIRYEQQVKVHDDGRVSVQQVVAGDLDGVTPEALGMPADSFPPGSQDELCDTIREGINSAVPSGVGTPIVPTLDNYSDDGFCGVTMKFELPAAPDHSDTMSVFFGTSTRLVVAGEGWEFETRINPAQLAAGGRSAGISDAGISEALAAAEFELVLELPGSAIEGEHNADSVSGGKFTWNIDAANPPERLYAMTGPAGFSLPVSSKVLTVVLVNLAVILGVAWYFLRPEKLAPAVVEETNAAVIAAPGAGAAEVTPGTPYYDETYKVWMLEDPVKGLLWHREGTDEWVPL